MLLVSFRHGLRASELCSVLHVRRAKNGTPATHPLSGRELRALRRLQRESVASPFVFVSERGAPFAVSGLQKLVARAGEAAGFDFTVHPHIAPPCVRLHACQ
jgi:integrase